MIHLMSEIGGFLFGCYAMYHGYRKVIKPFFKWCVSILNKAFNHLTSSIKTIVGWMDDKWYWCKWWMVKGLWMSRSDRMELWKSIREFQKGQDEWDYTRSLDREFVKDVEQNLGKSVDDMTFEEKYTTGVLYRE